MAGEVSEEQVDALRNYLRSKRNWVTQKDSVGVHRARFAAIWKRGLQLAENDVGAALVLCTEAVKSAPQERELSKLDYEQKLKASPEDAKSLELQHMRYRNRLMGVPTRAFGEPKATPSDTTDEDKPQHFFQLAQLAFEKGESAAIRRGKWHEFGDWVKSAWRPTGGWDKRDLVVNARGAAFGVALREAEENSQRVADVEIVSFLGGLEGPLPKKEIQEPESEEVPQVQPRKGSWRLPRRDRSQPLVEQTPLRVKRRSVLEKPSILRRAGNLQHSVIHRQPILFQRQRRLGSLLITPPSGRIRPQTTEPWKRRSGVVQPLRPRPWEPFGIRHAKTASPIRFGPIQPKSIVRPPRWPSYKPSYHAPKIPTPIVRGGEPIIHFGSFGTPSYQRAILRSLGTRPAGHVIWARIPR